MVVLCANNMRRRRENLPGYQTPSRHSPSINDFGFQRTHAREQIRKAAPPKFRTYTQRVHAKRLSKPHTCAQAETNQRHMGGSRQPQSCRSWLLSLGCLGKGQRERHRRQFRPKAGVTTAESYGAAAGQEETQSRPRLVRLEERVPTTRSRSRLVVIPENCLRQSLPQPVDTSTHRVS